MSVEQDGSPPAGGDPVCWLHRLCGECGAVPAPEVPGRCWRCGAPPGDDGEQRPPGDGSG